MLITKSGLLAVGNENVADCYSFVGLHFNNETLTDFYCTLKHTKLIDTKQ